MPLEAAPAPTREEIPQDIEPVELPDLAPQEVPHYEALTVGLLQQGGA